jgi:hypothetical protein
MKKTSVYIDPEVDRGLGRRAAAEGTTKAAVIREALAKAAGENPRPRALGVFSGPRDLSRNVDDYLTKTGFGSR